jgi:hypothetical protein
MPQPVNSQRSQHLTHDSLSSQPTTPAPVRVAFQGERGAFGDEAVGIYFGEQSRGGGDGHEATARTRAISRLRRRVPRRGRR